MLCSAMRTNIQNGGWIADTFFSLALFNFVSIDCSSDTRLFAMDWLDATLQQIEERQAEQAEKMEKKTENHKAERLPKEADLELV